MLSSVSYTLGHEVENLTLTGAAAINGTGNDLSNTVTGNGAANVLNGGAGADRLVGGLGQDIYQIDEGDVVVEEENGGIDEVQTSFATYALGANVENLRGASASGQTLTGNGLANAITGGGGNDVLDGAAGADQLAGGLGNDIYFVGDGDGVAEAASAGTDEVRTALSAYALAANVENLLGLSASGQTLTGNGLVNAINGGAGNDVIDGAAGADQLAGGLGNDIYVADAGDGVTEAANAGTDEVRTVLAAYTLGANVENLRGLSPSGQILSGNVLVNAITGGGGNDVIDGGAGADLLVGGLGNDVYVIDAGDTVTEAANAGMDEIRTVFAAYTLGANLEYLTGTSPTGQALTGNALANRLTGAGGNDTLDGAAGADQLAGGLGNDLYRVDAGDTVVEAVNAGTDEVQTALAAYALTANVENLTGTLASGQALTGNGLANVVTGGGGNDTLNGGEGADRLTGGLGNDIYVFDAGDMVVEAANAGTDEVRTALAAYTLAASVEKLTGTAATGQSLTGNGLANQLAGGQGNDTLDGGAGPDQLAGGLGNDVYVIDSSDTVTEAANAGTDEIRTALAAYTLIANVENLRGLSAGGQTLTGNALANRLNGGSGNDILDGRAGTDQLAGGAGDDSYRVSDSTDAIVELAGEGANDRVHASVNYTLGTGVHAEILSTDLDTGTAPLILAGNELDNRIIGNAGANTLYGIGGIDRLEGLAGNDSYVVDRAEDVVVEAAGQGYDTVFSPVSYTLAAGSEIEGMSTLSRLGTQAIDFTGNAFHNMLYGNAGANRLSGGAGNDTLDGGAGNDRLDGGLGNDTATYADAASAVTVSLATTAAQNTGGGGTDTLVEVENLLGSAYADVLTGNGLANVLDGRGGADRMAGGAGHDVYYVDHAGDTVVENFNGGTDELRTTLATYSLVPLFDFEILTAASDIAHDFRGNSRNNVIIGGGGADILRLYDGGSDIVNAGAGNDTILFIGTLTAADRINGGDGVDTLVIQGPYGALTLTANIVQIETISILAGSNPGFGDPGTNRYDYVLTTHDSNFAAGVQARIDGSALLGGESLSFDGSAETNASFVVSGGKASDTLKGGGQADLIHGNLGADILAGGGGADTFRYDMTAESNSLSMDQILDFTPGTDKIDLSRIDARTNLAGDQAFIWIGSTAFSGNTAQLRAFEQGGVWILQGDVNGDRIADFTVALTLQGPAPLGAGDFIL
ncbi:MAG: beta strand repeat-containing protein [Allosphingosinicella sp.]